LNARLLALVVALAVTASAAAKTPYDPAMAPGEAVADTSQIDWSRAYWQWLMSFERGTTPLTDRTGELCAARQRGPVWFLAGSHSTRRVVRSCRIPRDKYVFVPLVSSLVQPLPGSDLTCGQATQSAAEATNDPEFLVLDVDGVTVENLQSHRLATTNCFDTGVYTESRAPVYPSAANGYYVILKPLPPGRHVVNFGGVAPNMGQAVTYTITVE
jgi:hypothetical protein